MILYLPCSRFRIRYTLSSGTPYSNLDRLLLRSISEGAQTVEELSEIFKLHNSLLVQSLVGLIQAGWIALGESPETQFVLTVHGKTAIENNQVPKSIVFRPDSTDILLERVTGCLIPAREVTYRNRVDLDIDTPWDHPQVLQPVISKKSLEEGEVQYLLPRRLGERLHWINNIIKISRDFEYIPLDVDIKRGLLVNFPSHRSLFLHEKVIDFAKKAYQQEEDEKLELDEQSLSLPLRPMGESIFKLPSNIFSMSWTNDTLLSDVEDMSSSLLNALERASTYLLIASREMSISTIQEIEEKLVMALKRGVILDILWGNNADIESLNCLQKLAITARQENYQGKLTFNKDTCNFNATLIIFDNDEAVFEAIVSNYDWLSSPIRYGEIAIAEFGLRVHHLEIIASLARSIAGFANEITSNHMHAFVNRWKRIASELPSNIRLDGENAKSGDNLVQLQLVQSANDHLNALLKFNERATNRFYVLSSLVNNRGKRRIAGISKNSDSDIKTFAIVGFDNSETKPIEIVGDDGFQMCGELNSNVIVSDDAVCISSCPPLLTSNPGREEKNLGIIIYSQICAQSISDQIDVSFFPKANKTTI